MKWLWAVLIIATHMKSVATVGLERSAGTAPVQQQQQQLASRRMQSGRKLTQLLNDWEYNCISGGPIKVGIATYYSANSTGNSTGNSTFSTASSTIGSSSSSSLSMSTAGEVETLPAGAVLKAPPKARRQPSPGLLAALRDGNRGHGPASVGSAAVDSASVVAEAAATALPGDGEGLASSSSSSSGTEQGLVKPASICRLDPPFRPLGMSATTCRLIIHSLDGYTFLCTAWFMSDKHVVTAGHCVHDSDVIQNGYNINPDNPGYMCCGFNDQGDCMRGRKWRLLKWVVAVGWARAQYESNDGAMLEVTPWDPTVVVPPVPQAITTFYPGPIPQHFAWLDGYPYNSNEDLGCASIDIKKRYYTRAKVRPVGLPRAAPGKTGITLQYALGGCVGESGGRVLLNKANGTAYGIQTWGATTCIGGRGVTGVTQITLTQERCGVCLPCLQNALIAAG